MRILHVITSLNNGGAENHLAELASLQSRQKNKVIDIIYLRGDGYWVRSLRKKKISIKKFDIEKNYDLIKLFIAIIQISKYIKETKPEIVHAHLSLSEIIVAFIKIIFRLNFKMIVSKHLDSFLFEGSSGQNRYFNGLFLEKIIFKVSTQIIFISKNVQLYFLSKVSIPKKKRSIIYYGIDRENLINQKKSKNNEIKIKIKKNRNEKLILNIARHTSQKKIDSLIKGFAEYLKTNKNARLVLVGSGKETKNLKLLASQLRVESKIYWVSYTNYVCDLFEIADVFCLTSRYEGLGLVLLESLALKVPVITMNSGAMKEVIKNNFSGVLLSQNFNSKSLSTAIIKIMTNKKFRQKIIENGVITLNNKFTTKKMLELTSAVYEKK